jgi:hypothetical protein
MAPFARGSQKNQHQLRIPPAEQSLKKQGIYVNLCEDHLSKWQLAAYTMTMRHMALFA